jgi:hypothetical protein
MSDKNDKTNWAGKAAIAAGAAIGSAAIAAALLYTRRKDKPAKPTAPPPHPQDAPETD